MLVRPLESVLAGDLYEMQRGARAGAEEGEMKWLPLFLAVVVLAPVTGCKKPETFIVSKYEQSRLVLAPGVTHYKCRNVTEDGVAFQLLYCQGDCAGWGWDPPGVIVLRCDNCHCDDEGQR